MYLENFVSIGLAAFFPPRCLTRELRHPESVSFVLPADLNVLSKRSVFARPML